MVRLSAGADVEATSGTASRISRSNTRTQITLTRDRALKSLVLLDVLTSLNIN